MYTEKQIIAAWYKTIDESSSPTLSALLRALKSYKPDSTDNRLPYVPPIPKRDRY